MKAQPASPEPFDPRTATVAEVDAHNEALVENSPLKVYLRCACGYPFTGKEGKDALRAYLQGRVITCPDCHCFGFLDRPGEGSGTTPDSGPD